MSSLNPGCPSKRACAKSRLCSCSVYLHIRCPLQSITWNSKMTILHSLLLIVWMKSKQFHSVQLHLPDEIMLTSLYIQAFALT